MLVMCDTPVNTAGMWKACLPKEADSFIICTRIDIEKGNTSAESYQVNGY